jgi:Tfp pilus assembly protein FimT
MSRSQQRRRRRPSLGAVTTELAGALAVVSQMALLSPPGFDDWVRRELAGDAATNGPRRPSTPR